MNDAIEVPVDRIPLTPPRPSKLFDELDELLAKKAAEAPKPKPEESSAGASPAARPPEESPKPAPKPRWVKDALAWGRRRTVIATAAGSIVAGALAVNALFSGADRTPPDQPKDQPPAALAAAPPEAPKPAEMLSPSPFGPSSEPIVKVPEWAPRPATLPAPTVAPDVGAIPSPSLPLGGAGAPSVTPPAVPAPSVAGLPPPSVTPESSLVLPASAIEPAGQPGAGSPTAPPEVKLPTLPPKVELPGSTPTPEAPKPAPEAPKPAPSVPAPELPKPAAQSLPPPALPTPELPKPATPTLPPPTAPDVPAPTLPAPDLPKPTLPEPSFPAAAPTVEPSPAPKLPPPSRTPAETTTPFPTLGASSAPAVAPTTPAPAPLALTKPPGDTAVRPVGMATDAAPPRTGFDVDLHVPKAGDTFATISQLHYGDAKYAAALRAFNHNADLARVKEVEVPPMYVLRKQFAQFVGAGRPEPTADGRGVEWASGGAKPAATTYTVTRDGMTLRDVAEAVYGSPKEWQKVWDANLNVMADEKLPAGKVLRLPR